MSLLHFSGLLGYPRGFVLLLSRMRTKKSEKAYISSLWTNLHLPEPLVLIICTNCMSQIWKVRFSFTGKQNTYWDTVHLLFCCTKNSNSYSKNNYCFTTQSGHLVLKWVVFNFTVFHSKLVTLLFSSIYFLSEVLVVNHGSFQMQRIFSIF